jgi:hypothetical protein
MPPVTLRACSEYKELNPPRFELGEDGMLGFKLSEREFLENSVFFQVFTPSMKRFPIERCDKTISTLIEPGSTGYISAEILEKGFIDSYKLFEFRIEKSGDGFEVVVANADAQVGALVKKAALRSEFPGLDIWWQDFVTNQTKLPLNELKRSIELVTGLDTIKLKEGERKIELKFGVELKLENNCYKLLSQELKEGAFIYYRPHSIVGGYEILEVNRFAVDPYSELSAIAQVKYRYPVDAELIEKVFPGVKLESGLEMDRTSDLDLPRIPESKLGDKILYIKIDEAKKDYGLFAEGIISVKSRDSYLAVAWQGEEQIIFAYWMTNIVKNNGERYVRLSLKEQGPLEKFKSVIQANVQVALARGVKVFEL